MVHSLTPDRSKRTSLASISATRQRAHRSCSVTRVLPDVSGGIARPAGASDDLGGAARAHQKGRFVFATHAFTFVPRRPVHQQVHRFDFFMEAPMRQTEIPLLARIEGPAVVPSKLIDACTTYRQAVRLCWTLRRVKGAKPSDMAQHTGMVRQHVSDYLNPDDKPGRRDLPGGFVEACEDYCGNNAISQWHAARSKLTVLEQLQAERAAA